MFKNLSRVVISSIYITLLTACGTPSVIKDVKDKNVESLDINSAASAKPIQLSKVVVKLKRGEHVGAVQGGLLCVSQGDLNWKGGRLNIDSEEFTDAFKEELEKFSFKTVGDTSALFEDPNTWKSEILIASLVKDLKANICFPYAGFGNFQSAKGEAFIKAEWQIYSKLDRAVVHTVTTEGAYKATEASQGGVDAVILNAFTQAARNLLADEKFREIVAKGGQSIKETTFKTGEKIVVSSGKAKALTSSVDEWKDGVVTVYAGKGHGSGFVIAENIVLTNHHVVGGTDHLIVKFGSGFEVKGEVVAYNSGLDIAAVRINASLPKFFKLDRNLPISGTDVYAVGTPLSDDLIGTVSKGIVSGIRHEEGRKLIQSDVNVRPGNSGGPLVTKDGLVVGVTVSGLQVKGASQGINFFIPIADALDALKLAY